MRSFVPYLQIICTTIVACMIYGLIHAIVATQIPIIYYAAFYPLPEGLIENPLLLGLILGIATSWWLGLSMGFVFSLACRKGDKPKLVWKDLIKPIRKYLVVAICCTAIAGSVGYWFSVIGILQLPDAIYHVIMDDEEAGFWSVGFMNLTGYGAACVGCIWVVLQIRSTRQRLSVDHED